MSPNPVRIPLRAGAIQWTSDLYPDLPAVSIYRHSTSGTMYGPSEPENAERKRDAACDYARQTPLGNRNTVVGCEFALVPRLLEQDCDAGRNLPGDHTEKCQPGLAHVETVHALEDDRVGCQEQI